jgi:pimeloyl-ACP methyl ester carboxylesterase
MAHSPTEFASREEAMAFLKGTRGDRETEASLNHRIDHNLVRVGNAYRVKYDPIRVAQGLTHMAKDLRSYAARVTCPVLTVRSTVGSDLSSETATEITSLWKNGRTVDVDGGYLLYIQNPAGVAEAITDFVEFALSVPSTAAHVSR